MRALDERVKLTMDYMNSPTGIRNWFENQRRGYDRRKNIIAAIQTATRLLVWERIMEVCEAVAVKCSERGGYGGDKDKRSCDWRVRRFNGAGCLTGTEIREEKA
jgi:hypothetical protein